MSEDKVPASRPMSDGQPGESGGGPYPNPHGGNRPKGDFKGGRSDRAYHGTGRLGDEKVGDNENAPSGEG